MDLCHAIRFRKGVRIWGSPLLLTLPLARPDPHPIISPSPVHIMPSLHPHPISLCWQAVLQSTGAIKDWCLPAKVPGSPLSALSKSLFFFFLQLALIAVWQSEAVEEVH